MAGNLPCLYFVLSVYRVMVRPRRYRKLHIRVEDKAFDGLTKLDTV